MPFYSTSEKSSKMNPPIEKSVNLHPKILSKAKSCNEDWCTASGKWNLDQLGKKRNFIVWSALEFDPNNLDRLQITFGRVRTSLRLVYSRRNLRNPAALANAESIVSVFVHVWVLPKVNAPYTPCS